MTVFNHIEILSTRGKKPFDIFQGLCTTLGQQLTETAV